MFFNPTKSIDQFSPLTHDRNESLINIPISALDLGINKSVNYALKSCFSNYIYKKNGRFKPIYLVDLFSQGIFKCK